MRSTGWGAGAGAACGRPGVAASLAGRTNGGAVAIVPALPGAGTAAAELPTVPGVIAGELNGDEFGAGTAAAGAGTLTIVAGVGFGAGSAGRMPWIARSTTSKVVMNAAIDDTIVLRFHDAVGTAT